MNSVTPPGAQQALTQLPEIAAYLPCRIVIYEENYVTKLSTIGLEEMLAAVEVNEEFRSYMTLLFMNLKQVMHSWDN
ncbi:DUF302 domain-containing protein [Sulfurovum lithotrophicum]|uniref:DUF302 domain-containing protein n=1 Tax=Sulfurovum lithotrophicum TaxID=206403 RepID=UPI001CB70895|nr:DUF302 domain-containing protein [Sulfurovum lithotrophicum]